MHYDVHLNEVSPCLTATEKNMNLVLIEYSRTVEDHDVSDESFRILIFTTRNGDNKGPLQVALKHLTIAGNVQGDRVLAPGTAEALAYHPCQNGHGSKV